MRITIAGIAAVGLVLLFFLRGYSRGVVREIISLVGLAVVGVSIWYVTPYVNTFFKENTGVYAWVESGCSALVQKVADRMGVSDMDALDQAQVVQQLPVTEGMREEILSQNPSQAYGALSASSYLEYVSQFLTEKVYGAACVLISCLLASIVVGFFASLLGGIASLPGIREVNRLAGGLLGAVKGAFLVWVCLLILTVAMGTQWGERGLAMASQDTLLSWMIEYTIDPLSRLGIQLGEDPAR